MQANVHDDRLELVLLAYLWTRRGKAASNAPAIGKGIKLIANNAGDVAQAALDRLAAAGQVGRIEPKTKKGKPAFQIAAAGEARAVQMLGLVDPPATLAKLCASNLAPIALGLAVPDKKSQKDAAKLLPLAVCVRAKQLDVPLDGNSAHAKLELVKLALSRSHGVPVGKIYLKKLPAGELPAIVAGLALGEKETAAANIEKLLESVACKILQVSKAANIPAGVVRRWLADGAPAGAPALPASRAEAASPPPPAPAATVAAAAPVDLATFAKHVVEAGRAVAAAGREGVSSLGDKVLVHYCWRRYEQMFGLYPLEQFKHDLSIINGKHLDLVREDLIPAERREEFFQSEVKRGVSSFHYVRIGQLGVRYGPG